MLTSLSRNGMLLTRFAQTSQPIGILNNSRIQLDCRITTLTRLPQVPQATTLLRPFRTLGTSQSSSDKQEPRLSGLSMKHPLFGIDTSKLIDIPVHGTGLTRYHYNPTDGRIVTSTYYLFRNGGWSSTGYKLSDFFKTKEQINQFLASPPKCTNPLISIGTYYSALQEWAKKRVDDKKWMDKYENRVVSLGILITTPCVFFSGMPLVSFCCGFGTVFSCLLTRDFALQMLTKGVSNELGVLIILILFFVAAFRAARLEDASRGHHW